jgi:hypothetical protein
VVASDERNELQIYKRGQPRPVGALDLSKFLDTKEGEGSDLEGAAMIGTRICWIASHSLNKEGKVRERRHRFFATEVQPGQTPSLRIVGKRAYTNLLRDLVTAKKLDALKLADAATLKPEDVGGLNIEGLAATPEGYLLIGFRNPVPDGLALVVPLENPRALSKGRSQRSGSRSGWIFIPGVSAVSSASVPAISSLPDHRTTMAVSRSTAGREQTATHQRN